MGVAAHQSRLRSRAEGRTTAFERNLLPGFSNWLLEQIERWEPDLLIPAETKGARVLDAALSCAAFETGAPVRVPILYKSALDFLPHEELSRSRVMIVEDAVRTGSNLNRHRDEIRISQVRDIVALACMGHGDSFPEAEVDCYLRVDDDLYMQYLWQLTELVTAPGLPPEVDHFVFELRFGCRFEFGWRELQHSISDHGRLTVDGPEDRREELQPMTLHFPDLLGSAGGLTNHLDGPQKIRFFPDPDDGRVFVVPISFASLDLPPEIAKGGSISKSNSHSILERAGLAHSAVGSSLVEASRQRDPKTVFRILSAARETEMVIRLASLLAPRLPDVSVVADEVDFERLFGREVGAVVCAHASRAIDAELRRTRTDVARDRSAHTPDLLYLDRDVAMKTRDVAERLKELHESEAGAPGFDPASRIGWPMAKLAEELDDGEGTLASRCVDFGLAMTTLVPYVDAIRRGDGSVLVERLYRVSENNRIERPYTDLDRVRCEKAEQAVAVICNRIRHACEAFGNRGIPRPLLTRVVAILRPLVLEQQSLTLESVPGDDGLRLLILRTFEPVDIDSEASRYFAFDDAGDVVPTEHFEDLYKRQRLTLDLDGCTEGIETHVDQIAQFINDLGDDELETLLDGWAMSTDRRLGLTHVRRSLDQALKKARRPLQLILRGETHEPSTELSAQIAVYVRAAKAKLDLLDGHWSRPAAEMWGESRGRREARLRASLYAPEGAPSFYGFPWALTELISEVAQLSATLDSASVALRSGGDQASAHDSAAAVLGLVSMVGRGLSSLEEQDQVDPSLPEDPQKAIEAAAEGLDELLERLAAFTAALAGAFRGTEGARRPARQMGQPRHASVLSLDVAGSTAHGEVREERSHNRWLREGLNVAAQWTRAFGGWELADRKGDEITVEFAEDGDAGALAAVSVLAHARALRAIGSDALSWRFHNGIDCGEVEDADGNNVMGGCLNRAAKLGKHGDAKEEANKVLLSDTAAERCSEDLRSGSLLSQGDEVILGEIDDEEIRHRPRILDSGQAFDLYAERVAGLAESLAVGSEGLRPAEEPLTAEEPTGSGDLDEGREAAI